MKSFSLSVLIFFVLLIISSAFGSTPSNDFLTVDCNSGLFSDGQNNFPLICVTYVQPYANWPGANSGRTQVLLFDLTKVRPDFRQMRKLGVNAIYMRIGAGVFFNPDGSWRKLDDPVLGVPDTLFSRSSIDKIEAERKYAVKAGIGPFTYAYEVFDYLLDCAAAEGIYVVPAILDSWSIPRKYERSVIKTAIFHDDAWQSIVTDWTKILGRLKNRHAIAGYLIDGELMCTLPTWTDKEWFFLGPKGQRLEVTTSPLESYDKEIVSEFQSFLEHRYGTIDNLKSVWRYGYDRDNPTFNSNTKIPLYKFKSGVFDSISSFVDINLPTTERPKGGDSVGRGKNFPYWANVPLDPIWLDFNYFRQWLFTTRINEFVAKMREVDPNHLFMYSAAADILPAWYPFIICWDHGKLDCEVLLHGGGYTRAVNNSTMQPDSYETIMELYKSVGLYRPSSNSGSKSCVFGMGEGGFSFESNNPKAKIENLPETLQDRWVSQLLMDNFGSGGGFTNIWDWGTITGSTVKRPELHVQKVAESIKMISNALKKDKFSKNRNAKILILVNGPTLNSIMNSISLNNIISLASSLAMTHRSFDIVTTDEISFGESSDKVDINRYNAILMPQLYQMPRLQIGPYTTFGKGANIWRMIDKWLRARHNRLLCLGLVGMRDAYFSPMDNLPKEFSSIVGDMEIGNLYKMTAGKTKDNFFKTACGGALKINLSGLLVHDITLQNNKLEQFKPFLYYDKRILGAKRTLDNGSVVYQFGFPLGLSWMPLFDKNLSGKGIDKKQTSELAKFYKSMLNEAGVKAAYDSPESIVAYISDNAKTIFIRQRFSDGLRSGKLLSSRLIAGHIYAGVKTVTTRRNGQLTGEIVGDLGENLSAVLTSIGTIEMIKDGTTEILVTPVNSEGSIKYNLEVTGGEFSRIQLDAWEKN